MIIPLQLLFCFFFNEPSPYTPQSDSIKYTQAVKESRVRCDSQKLLRGNKQKQKLYKQTNQRATHHDSIA